MTDKMDEQIEAYLLGKLDTTQKALFEKRLLEEPALAQAFQLHQLEHQAMEVLLERDLRSKMDAWDAEAPTPPATQWKKYLWIIVLLTVALAGAGIYLLNGRTQPTTPQNTPPAQKEVPDMANHAQPPISDTPNLPQQKTIVRNSPLIAMAERAYSDQAILSQLRNTSTDPQSVAAQYASGQYVRVIHATDAVSPNAPDYLRQMEMRGHAFFHLKNYAKAATAFKILAESNKEPYAERSDWYLLLALAAQGEMAKKALIQQRSKILSSTEHSYYKPTLQLEIK